MAVPLINGISESFLNQRLSMNATVGMSLWLRSLSTWNPSIGINHALRFQLELKKANNGYEYPVYLRYTCFSNYKVYVTRHEHGFGQRALFNATEVDGYATFIVKDLVSGTLDDAKVHWCAERLFSHVPELCNEAWTSGLSLVMRSTSVLSYTSTLRSLCTRWWLSKWRGCWGWKQS